MRFAANVLPIISAVQSVRCDNARRSLLSKPEAPTEDMSQRYPAWTYPRCSSSGEAHVGYGAFPCRPAKKSATGRLSEIAYRLPVASPGCTSCSKRGLPT
jgi:hypothetical protein